MRLTNRIVVGKEVTFETLKFSALRRETHVQNEDGTVSERTKEHTYDLKSRGQGYMTQASIPANVPLKKFDYDTEVEVTHPAADTAATATSQEADMGWYTRAEDITLKKGAVVNLQPPRKDHPAEK